MTLAWLAGALGCGEEPIPLRMLTEEPVVMGISLAVVEDGPHAVDLAPLPPDRPRAEVLPLDVVELDALVANADGPLDLADAAWVLCGGPCLASMTQQGERYGDLEECTETSAASAYACLAGRGPHPHVAMPAFAPFPDVFTQNTGASIFGRVAVITGSPGGSPTDVCLEQLVRGPAVDLHGCAVGVREVPYGPAWTLLPLLEPLFAENGMDYDDTPALPPFVAGLLPPNAAPQIEAVRIGAPEDFVRGQPDEHVEPRSVHEEIELEAGARFTIEPVVSLRDQQLLLIPVDPLSWVGQYERSIFEIWADAPIWDPLEQQIGGTEQLDLLAPDVEGPVRVYVVVTDVREGLSWFTLDLQVVTP